MSADLNQVKEHRTNGSLIDIDADPLIDQAHAVAAALANQLLPNSGGGERLCDPFLLSLAQAMETLLGLASLALIDERNANGVILGPARSD